MDWFDVDGEAWVKRTPVAWVRSGYSTTASKVEAWACQWPSRPEFGWCAIVTWNGVPVAAETSLPERGIAQAHAMAQAHEYERRVT